MHFLPVITLLCSILLASAQNITHNGIGSSAAERHVISSTQAQTVLAAAEAHAKKLGSAEVIAITTPSGYLVALLALDDSFPGTVDVAIKKARTTAIFNGSPTADLYALAQPGGSGYGIEETNGGLVVFGGGVPIYLNGRLIGAIGCSGSPLTSTDIEIATVGAAALSS